MVLSDRQGLCYNSVRSVSRAVLGRGAMVAQRTLDPFILVRIRAPQLNACSWKIFASEFFNIDELHAACLGSIGARFFLFHYQLD
jgi:hypothetical protein